MAREQQYTFARPFRPVGIKVFNAIGGALRSVGCEREITVDRLLRSAQRSTGLSDFGSDDFLEPLSILVHEFQNTANFNPFGHSCMRRLLQQHLENRLLLEAAWKRHPEFLQQPLNRPLYVVGMPRTGTTLLYNLLSQDPNSRPLMIWETLYPAPTEKEDRKNDDWYRRFKSKVVVKGMNWLAPNLKQIHAIEPDTPEECGWLMNNTFVSLMFLLDSALPTYFEYFRNLPHERLLRVYDYYRRELQLVQRGDTQRHWILKSPIHQGTLLPLMESIPQANIIQTHRDPKKVIPSCCSLVCTTRGIFTDHLDVKATGDEFATRMTHAIENARKAEEKFPERMTDVLFDDLVKDPLGTVKRIYERFGYRYSEEMEAGMKRWLAENPQGKHGAHKYELEQFGLTDAEIDRVFGSYWPRKSTF